MSISRKPVLALSLLAVSQLMLALDFTIIFVALPSLAADLGFAAHHLQWVVSAYALAYGGFLLIGGRLSDLAGRRRMFIVAMGLFGVGSLLGGLSATQLALVLARGLQGLGGALLSPAALSLIMSNFREGPERNRALAVWAATGGVGLSLGLLLGGWLTSAFGWEWTFFVNVPIALLVMLLSPTALAETKAAAQTRHYDAAGALSVTAGMLLLVYYLIQAPVDGWLHLRALPFGLAGAALLAAFVVVELRSKEPLLPLRLFRVRSLRGATLTAALFSASFGTLYYFLTLYTQVVLSYTAIQSGLAFLPLTISALIGARWIGKSMSSLGAAGTVAVGMGLGAVGFALLIAMSGTASFWGVLPGTLLIGFGQAFVFTSMYIAGSAGIPPKEQGVASAIISTGQQMGSAIGLAAAVAVISVRLGTTAPIETMASETMNAAVSTSYAFGTVVALSGVLVSFLVLRGSPAANGTPAAETKPMH